MKIYIFSSSIYLIISFLAINSKLEAQAVSPSHLFRAGLNMGLLSGHVKSNTNREKYGTWAGNASAEWIESWKTGMVEPIIPDITMPSIANEDMITAITHMNTCLNPYFQARLSLYKAGFHLGESLAQTGTGCSQCLQVDLQRSAIELKTISVLIKNPLYSEMSDNLNNMAAALNMDYLGGLAQQQNESQFTPLNSIIQTIRNDLPTGMEQCEGNTKSETAALVAKPPAKQEPTKPTKAKQNKTKKQDIEKRDKRAFIFKAGMNTGALRSSNELKTEGKTGWHVGFDMFNGRKFILVSGLKFWRNATGEDLMPTSPSQYVDAEDYYIQGFTIGLGPGYYLYRRGDTNISLTGKFNFIISHAINGDLNSAGFTSLESNVYHLEFGLQTAYKILFLETSYEFGLNDALVSDSEGYKYGLFNLSVGVYIR